MIDAAPPAVPAANARRTPPRGRPWTPGTSGNPGGRPAGSRTRAALAADALAGEQTAALVQATVAAALAGDAAARAEVLRRVWPVPRGRRLTLALPELHGPEDAAAALAATVQAVAGGALTVDEAMGLSALIHRWAETVALPDLAARLEALERAATA